MSANSVESEPLRLSRRELEIAGLVAEGLTNREIAGRLFISERTVDGHLEHVREKLGVNTRAQIAAWVVRHDMVSHETATARPVSRPDQGRRGIARHRTLIAGAVLLAIALALVVAILGLRPSPTFPPGPIITTIAGTGSLSQGTFGGYSGDGSFAIHAELSRPSDIAAGRDGIYVDDYGNGAVRLIGRNGRIRTVAGGGTALLADGATATAVSLGYASKLAVDDQGRLYLLTNLAGSLEVWMLRSDSTMARIVSLGASSGGGPPALFQPVGGLALAKDGTMYIADRAENRVWKRTPDGTVSIYAGTGQAGYSGDLGSARSAQLNWPIGLAVDQDNLYIADSGNHRIRKVNIVSGVITTVAGSSSQYGDGGDGGIATQARLSFPYGVAVGRDGTLFIADTGNNRVREVTPAGRIEALAGTGRSGFKGDGGPASQAELSGPTALSLDISGQDLLLADTDNHRVRELPLLLKHG